MWCRHEQTETRVWCERVDVDKNELVNEFVQRTIKKSPRTLVIPCRFPNRSLVTGRSDENAHRHLNSKKTRAPAAVGTSTHQNRHKRNRPRCRHSLYRLNPTESMAPRLEISSPCSCVVVPPLPAWQPRCPKGNIFYRGRHDLRPVVAALVSSPWCRAPTTTPEIGTSIQIQPRKDTLVQESGPYVSDSFLLSTLYIEYRPSRGQRASNLKLKTWGVPKMLRVCTSV